MKTMQKRLLLYNASTECVLLTEPQFAEADIYIIALNDAALEQLKKLLRLKGS